MKKIILVIFISFISSAIVADELKNKLYDSASEQLSANIGNLIPGEGVTEVSIEITDEKDDDLDFSILAVRDIVPRANSNFFTQFSFHNTKVDNDDRFIANIGLGYRFLSPEENFMLGLNAFYDEDIENEHARASLGLEAKGSVLDFSANKYQKATNMKVVNGTEEQVLSGWDYNLSSQLPHMPWAIFNYKGYKNEKEKASEDTEGSVYSLEVSINPSVELNLSLDNASNSGIDDVIAAQIKFVYPPKEKNYTMQAGLSENVFEKENMQKKLKEKVRRNNNLVVEIQGAVIVTSK
tara:strand:- start:1049 stop:1933 length:885 start_codon:yes stop_codon:yes gene_type:complete